MINSINAYIKRIDQLYHTQEATEHSYRSALEELMRNCTGYKNIINEPKHIDCGAPDLTINNNKDIPLAYIEAKNIDGGDLDGRKKNKEQFDRYKAALHTIIFTDYIDFHLYEDGKFVKKAELAYSDNGHIYLNEDAIQRFTSIIEHLKNLQPQTISSPSKLATLMANKAKMIAEAVRLDLKNDKEKKGSLHKQLEAFKNILDKTLDEQKFADLYAQTVAYGLFAARLHSKTPNFTLDQAAKLIPQTIPFLRALFQQLAGYDLKDSIEWIVDDLVAVFAATDVEKLRKNITREMEKRDPMIHFYEEFLGEYDPTAKKKYGVYYTPKPVVEFIVGAVDDILKTDFGIEQGLADKSKVSVPIKEVKEGESVATTTIQQRHRVQILDPATGTGTFLAEVVSRIKEPQQDGIWQKYVDEHLIPRIHGFEYMIAPYTIAHLKLDMLINWWGDKLLTQEHKDRVNIYLTNALTQTDLIDKKSSIAAAIAEEANDANEIKHNAPVMVVMGNPPYSGESSNTSEWIMGLMEDYKKEPNSDKKLNEKNPKWINNDYCKFIRMAQDYVDRRGEGIVAYICANSFLDNPTFRGMRWSLLKSFDKIYIINLHGNSKPKPEKCPDGSTDENVFDITVGTSINIFIKKGETATDNLAKVYYSDLYGVREFKYDYLALHKLEEISFAELKLREPYYFFIPQDLNGEEEYKKGFKLEELSKTCSVGVVTANDSVLINRSIHDLEQNVIKCYGHFSSRYVKNISYRPFDQQYIYYDVLKVARSRVQTMKHMLRKNIGLIAKKGFPNNNPPIFISEFISEFRYWSCSGMQGGDYVFPLYLYDDNETIDNSNCLFNLDEVIWRRIENWVKYGQVNKPLTANEQSGLLGFDSEPEEPHFLHPEDIFDYIYGVLHSPNYREKYKEFLKVDFPRIPYPKNKEYFDHYKDCGHQLRELHLMRQVPPVQTILSSGSGEVTRAYWDNGKVYINDTQYFDNVPAEAWNMYIGGYQPAQKWLKDRKGRMLNTEEMEHYEKIIAVLLETNRIMQQMDNPLEQVEELKKKVATLEQQLQAKQGDVHYHIQAQNISLQTEGTINIGEINETK